MNILISGAGIGGCTLAHGLARHGHRVSVVERSGGQRSSGAPVDVRGPALDVAERMGVTSKLQQASTKVDGMSFFDAQGRLAVRVDTSALHRASGRRDIELPRGDLAAILEAATRDRAEFVFGDSITVLAQDPGGVDVTFARGAPRRFDLVIGADGLHSGVRRLAFGPDERFVQHQGLYVATVPMPGSEVGRDVVMFNAPGRSLTLHPSRGKAMAAFIFWSPTLEAFDHHDEAQHRRFIAQTYAADGWRVPELLEVVRTTPDLYFDSVSRVNLPRWSSGRVSLVGDAASCVSLFGDGSTRAMAGAHTLADAIGEDPHDVPAALVRYEQRHRKLADPRKRGMSWVASLLVPRSQLMLRLRNAALRLWPLAQAAGRVKSALLPT